jgi:hypothetical protein
MIEKIDLDAILDTPVVPADAGEYAEGLTKILSRIPPRWGRWIQCDKGWYPLLCELDEKLAAIFPDYEVHQVKEKFGTLRYYIGAPELIPQCCIDIHDIRPSEGAVNPQWLRGGITRTLQEQYDLDQWMFNFEKHLESEDHTNQYDALEPERERRRDLFEKIHNIINEYEDRTVRTCESCGKEGALASKGARGSWYKTLCSDCAAEIGYMILEQEEDDE